MFSLVRGTITNQIILQPAASTMAATMMMMANDGSNNGNNGDNDGNDSDDGK